MRDGDRAADAVSRRPPTVGELTVWRALIDTTDELRKILGTQLVQAEFELALSAETV